MEAVVRDDVVRSVAVAAQCGVNVLLWGSPGIGKTSGVLALAEELGWATEVVIGSIRDATDIAGLPLRTEHGVELAPPAWALRLVAAHESGRRGLLFLDELTTSTPPVQAAMLRVVLERIVGDVVLPPSTVVIAAANPPDSAADGWDLAPPLANRFCHLSWPVDAARWCQGMLDGFALPEIPRLDDGWEAGIRRWQGLMAGFIHRRQEFLHALPDQPTQRGRAWPSPRTWAMVARLLAAEEAAIGDGSLTMRLAAGCVGSGPAAELIAWLETADLPDPEVVLADPASLPLPLRGDLLLAALGGMLSAVESNLDEERWNAAWEVLSRVSEAGQMDVAALSAHWLLGLRRDDWALPAVVETFAPLTRHIDGDP